MELSSQYFNGRTAHIVRNSITENTRYSELQSLKIDVLRNIQSYELDKCQYRWSENVKKKKDGFVKGYHIFKTEYKGEIGYWSRTKIEIQFEENLSLIRLHAIKKVEDP